MNKVTEQDAKDALIYKDGVLDYDAHDDYLRALGYQFLALPCECGGSDDDGHLPCCGWGKIDNVLRPRKLILEPKRTCNRHDDCARFDAEYMQRHKTDFVPFSQHCHSDDCEDCFGQ